jgi:acyl-CoA thioesterase-1
MNKKLAFSTVLSIMLSACGGGGGGGSSPTPPTAQQVTAKSVLIYADGDSTMYGWSVLPTGTVQAADSQPATIRADMRAAFSSVVVVENHAVGGTTVIDSINGTNGFNQPLGARLASSAAQIVIGNFEINDQYRMTPAQFGQGWQTWINTVKSLGKMPVMIEPNPICRSDAPNVGPYLDAERAVAAANNVLLVSQHDYIYNLPGWQTMLGDCVHPNDVLYKIMGDRDATAMASTVQKLLGG